MASTDQYGNKLPQSRIRKRDASRMVHEFRMQNKNPGFCSMCGFRVRGQNHTSGRHHQEAPRVIEANRIKSKG